MDKYTVAHLREKSILCINEPQTLHHHWIKRSEVNRPNGRFFCGSKCQLCSLERSLVMNCLSLTGQRTCSLYGECRYPATHERFFAPEEQPCSSQDACHVEKILTMQSLLYTLDRAEQVERNVKRGLPWHCGCPLCSTGKWHECYKSNGPDRELRSLIASGSYTAPWSTPTAKQDQASVESEEARAP